MLHYRPDDESDAGSARPPAELAQTATHLRAWNQASEADYLRAGSDLQSIHADLNASRKAVDGLTELMAGNGVARIDADLAACVDAAKEIGEGWSRSGEALRRIVAGVAQAEEGAHRIAEAFRVLSYVVLLGRSQKENLAEVRQRGSGFMDDMMSLVETGKKSCARLSETVDGLSARADTAGRAIRSFDSRDTATAKLPEELSSLAERLGERRASAEATRGEASQAFAGTAKSVASVVGVLQFHDIARQRLEHSLDNIDERSRALEGGVFEGPDGPLDANGALQAASLVEDLETAQIRDLIRIYDERMETVRHELERIGSDVTRIGELTDSVVSDGDGDGEDAISLIGCEAARIDRVFGAGGAERERVRDALADVVERAAILEELAGSLVTLQYDLTLASFNAAVRAKGSQSGSGAVSYIAREIRLQATVAQEGINIVKEGVAQALEASRDLGGSILPAIATAETTIRETFVTTKAALDSVAQESRESRETIAATGRSLPKRISKLNSLTTVHETGRELMHSLVGELEERRQAEPEPEWDEATVATVAAHLARSYSMSEERVVFETVFAESAVAITARASGASGQGSGEVAQGAVADEDDFELF